MRIKDGTHNRTIGFYDKIKDSRKLETFILSKVSRNIYNEVVERLGMKKDKDKVKPQK